MISTGLRSGSGAPNFEGIRPRTPTSPREPNLPRGPSKTTPSPVTPTPKFSRPRSASQPTSAPPKTVAFDLGSRCSSPTSLTDNETPSRPAADRGYETDDSDSTLDDSNRHHHRRRRNSYRRHPDDRHRPSSSTYPPTPDPRSSKSKHDRYQSVKDSARDNHDSDSESTIDLPARFDSHGRRKGEDQLVERFEDLLGRFINGIESSRRKSRGRRR
jgi:hypothetical protein